MVYVSIPAPSLTTPCVLCHSVHRDLLHSAVRLTPPLPIWAYPIEVMTACSAILKTGIPPADAAEGVQAIIPPGAFPGASWFVPSMGSLWLLLYCTGRLFVGSGRAYAFYFVRFRLR